MVIDITENGELKFNSKNYNLLKNGIVIFPENKKDVKKLKKLRKKLIKKFK